MKPKRTLKYKNKSISEIPVTISALSIGMLVTPMIIDLSAFFILLIASAAIVPITVAISADRKASIIVLVKAASTSSFEKSLIYHLKVNPPHRALDFDWLKEKTMSVNIGAYKNRKISPT